MGTLDLILQFCLMGGCCVHCYTDWKEKLLYDEVNLLILLTGFVQAYLYDQLLNALYGMLITGIVFLVLFIIAKGGMGLGDVKLAFALGAWLGWEQGLMSLLLAIWLGCAVGFTLILFQLKKRTDAIAFGPYMCVAGVLMFYYGPSIINWYFSLITYLGG